MFENSWSLGNKVTSLSRYCRTSVRLVNRVRRMGKFVSSGPGSSEPRQSVAVISGRQLDKEIFK